MADTGGGVKGTAPEISITTLSQRGGTYIVVQITDIDQALTVAAYSPGALTAEQFMNDTAGGAVLIGQRWEERFSVNSSGIYTFYALDSKENETVKTISITASRPDGGKYTSFLPGW